MPEKSAMTFLIFACVIISWPLRMPPSSRPMMTSTIAISTSVKPFAFDFMTASERAADQIGVGAVLHVRRARGLSGSDRRIRRRLKHRANRAGGRDAVVHLRVDCDRNLVGQVRRADDESDKA